VRLDRYRRRRPVFEPSESRLRNACMTFLGSPSRSDRLTPQKLSTSCRHSTPARISFGASCRIHAIRNFAFFDPRCKSGLQLGSEGPKLCPPRCDVNGMRQVSVVIDRNLHRQHHFPPSSIAPLQHLNLLSYPRQRRESYERHARRSSGVPGTFGTESQIC